MEEENKAETEQKETAEPAEQEKDAAQLVAEVRAEFAAKLAEQAKAYEAKLAERDRIIRELARGENQHEREPNRFDAENEKRKAERLKKW